MKKYLIYQHIFFCIHMVFLLCLGLLLADYNPLTAATNATICLLTMILSNQVIYAFKRTNIDYRTPNKLDAIEIPSQVISYWLMLATAIAQFYFPWSFDLRSYLNYPGLLPSFFFMYAMISAYQVNQLNK